MTIDPFWKSYVDECRAKGFPVVVAQPEPWFSIAYLCEHHLMIEKASGFASKCRAAGVRLMTVNQRPLIRFSDLEMVFGLKPVTSPKGKVSR